MTEKKDLFAIDWFSELLPVEYDDITILKCLRYLPKRRLVLLTKHEGKLVVMKWFARKQEYLQELNSYQCLKQVGFTLPEQYTATQSESYDVLLYDYIDSDLDVRYLSEAEQLNYFLKLTHLYRKLHLQGFVHLDPHLDNFKMKQGQIFLLDYGSLKKARFLFSLRRYWNVALLFAQFYPKYLNDLGLVIERYCECHRNSTVKLICYLVRRRFLRRVRKYQQKILRTCTEFNAQRKQNYTQVCRKDLGLLSDFDVRQLPVLEYLKKGNTATVWVSILNEQKIVVKRYNKKGFFWSLSHLFKKSRALISWQNAHYLEQCGVPTAKPLIYAAYFKNKLLQECYFVTEHIEGQAAHLYFKDHDVTGAQQRALHSLFSRMKRFSLCQTDLKASNLMIRSKDQLPVLIDLDSLRRYRFSLRFYFKWRKAKQRWLANWRSLPKERMQQLDCF